MKLFLTILTILASSARADETDFLIRIMHAEAQGEPITGVVAIGQAVITRAKNQKTTVCRVKGVKRSPPPRHIKPHYRSLATVMLSQPSESVSLGADSWNTGRKPRQPGNITTIISKHVFYVQKQRPEQNHSPEGG